ncbi:MAG TPA: ATP-binding protein [Pyrinomonadaceae bacterium]
MKKRANLKLIIFFTLLTSALTATVIVTWEKVLRPPFYGWVERNYAGNENIDVRWKIEQRVEHFFISMTVDVVVVSILLAIVDRQQRRLTESEQRYRALFEHANDGIAVVHAADFKLIEANSKFGEILGSDARALTGRDVRDLLRPQVLTGNRNGHSLSIASLFAESEADEVELMLGTTPNESRFVGVSFNTITANEERLIILLVRDLSTRKRLEEERQEMQRQLYQSAKLASLGELSAGVAHEINNPLNGVINFAQLLKDEPTSRTAFERQMIDGIIAEGGRIAEIVRGLLTFARHDENEPRNIQLDELISTSIALFGRQLEKDGVRIEIDLAPDLPRVRADASRLRQVVVNMVSNAHQALKSKNSVSGEEKIFRIAARRGESANDNNGAIAQIDFYDNGVGIRREDLPRVFDPFFTTRRETGGTGLGLSISFGIIRNEGGTLNVESEQGRYTRFRVELPAVEQGKPTHV